MKFGGIVCAFVVLLALAGCTQAQTPSTALHSTTPGASASTPVPTPTQTASSYIDDSASTYTLTDGDEVQVSWLSPSRNIECGIVLTGPSAHVWGCSVESHTWSAPSAQSADVCYKAGVDCGTGIEAKGDGKPGGRGETVFESQRAVDGPQPAPNVQTLPYGHSVTADGVTCVSLATGMTCTNAASGHSFTLSTSTYSTR